MVSQIGHNLATKQQRHQIYGCTHVPSPSSRQEAEAPHDQVRTHRTQVLLYVSVTCDREKPAETIEKDTRERVCVSLCTGQVCGCLFPAHAIPPWWPCLQLPAQAGLADVNSPSMPGEGKDFLTKQGVWFFPLGSGRQMQGGRWSWCSPWQCGCPSLHFLLELINWCKSFSVTLSTVEFKMLMWIFLYPLHISRPVSFLLASHSLIMQLTNSAYVSPALDARDAQEMVMVVMRVIIIR